MITPVPGRPRLLDLFSGAGGSAMGYYRAGFDVEGVDHLPQPHYPFPFHLGDALEYVRAHGHEYAAIHASPPCQRFTALRSMWNAREHPDLIAPTRTVLQEIGRPYIIENVEGAPLVRPYRLCGTMFGLGTRGYELRRHRLFEIWPWNLPLPLPCRHGSRVIGVYGDHVRDSRRWQKGGQFPGLDKRLLAGEAMGIDWMVWHELTQAIPPVYTEYVGAQLLQAACPEEEAG